MVHGLVKAPTLDITNKDLIESHLHAIWLSVMRLDLDKSIIELQICMMNLFL